MGFISNIIEKNRKLNTEFAGEYIIELFHKVEATDELEPYYYFGKEYFLCRTKGNPAAGIKQLTGEKAGKIYSDVKMEENQKGSVFFNISAEEFSGEVNVEKFKNERLLLGELVDKAAAYNAKVKTIARNQYIALEKDQFIVDLEFEEDECAEETLEETAEELENNN